MTIVIQQTRCYETGLEGGPVSSEGFRAEPPSMAESHAALAEAIEVESIEPAAFGREVVAPPRPTPLPRQSKSAAESPSTSGGGSPSSAARTPARRLSAEDVAEEWLGMEWLERCGIEEPSAVSFEDGDDALSREWLARCGL